MWEMLCQLSCIVTFSLLLLFVKEPFDYLLFIIVIVIITNIVIVIIINMVVSRFDCLLYIYVINISLFLI